MEKSEKEILQEISKKLDLLILITSLSSKSEKEQKNILKNYNGSFSKRDLERITGIDRHAF
jgi:hypothetical protein